jgi:multidrug resistance efflux pump
LAAPLIADTRRRYETQLAQKEAEVQAREAPIRDQQQQLASARQAIDAEVATRPIKNVPRSPLPRRRRPSASSRPTLMPKPRKSAT